MGRVKHSKRNRSMLNRTSVSKRWNTYKESEKLKSDELCVKLRVADTLNFDNDQPGPSRHQILRPIENNMHTEATECCEETTPRRKRPTGFGLVSSYQPQIDFDENAPSYCLVDLSILTNFLEGMPCKFCLDVNYKVIHAKEKGFANKISLHCLSCDQTISFQTSKQINDKTVKTRPPFDINRRMIKTFLSLGKGHNGLEIFSMGLNMPCIHHSAYDKQIDIIVDLAKEHVQDSLNNARTEVTKAYLELENSLEIRKPLDITVSYDGSWQKRGFTSKYGIGCVIEVITGLVIDFEVISKFCRICQQKASKLNEDSEEYEEWLLDHWVNCQANFDGSSPAMEVAGAERLWKRSQDIGFRYVSVVSDGDSKTHDHLSSLNIYGKDVQIEKQECVNHIAKRLGTGLRNLVKDCGKKKITLGGKAYGSLKGITIDKLTQYYRNAVIKNLEDIKLMKTAIFATLDHCRSTDTTPLHQNCPTGENSWCFYQRDIANNSVPRKHQDCIKTPINDTVYKHLLPLYNRLSSDDLLKRCSSGKTQNANESLHAVIWSKCPKTIFTGLKKLQALVAEGVCLYNEGHLQTMTKLYTKTGISPGINMVHLARKKDTHRLSLRNERDSEKYKNYRKLFKSAQLREEEQKKEKEGVSYGSGAF